MPFFNLTTSSPSGKLHELSGVVAPGDDDFSPLQIGDLEVWHDAAKGVSLSGSDVTQWADLSGNSRTLTDDNNAATPAQYVSSHAAFGNRPAIDFNSLNYRLEYTGGISIASGSFTFVYVVDLDNTAGTQELLDTQSGRMACYAAIGGNVAFYDGSIRNFAAAATGAQILTYVANADTNIIEVFRDGVSLGTTAYVARAIGDATSVGGRALALGAANNVEGKMAEMLIYSKALTTEQREAVEGRYSYV